MLIDVHFRERHNPIVVAHSGVQLQELEHRLVHAETLLKTTEHRVAGISQREDDLRRRKELPDVRQQDSVERQLVDQH